MFNNDTFMQFNYIEDFVFCNRFINILKLSVEIPYWDIMEEGNFKMKLGYSLCLIRITFLIACLFVRT